MTVTGLTAEVSLKSPYVVISTVTKHLFATRDEADSKAKDELVYRQAFKLFKTFLDASSKHTVEELQQFSNIRVPSPLSMHTPRVLVPLSCCEDASKYIIAAHGGEENAKKILGGVKWWQVRGIKGVDCQWISMKKDWQENKRRRKEQESLRMNSVSKKGKGAVNGDPTVTLSEGDPEPEYDCEIDEMRCMLYFHGGGYYFGSIDQERYVMQRFARKMNGRVFAVNYRLAPQYPFPCAIQDCLAAYLFLIQPPPGSKHAAISPSNIVIAGDSAGGGLALAVLQIIRDTSLPAPAGAVLISPWSDLTHSFPSIHSNTATDILPVTGLSMHKPSPLWPPPSEEMTSDVRKNLANKIKRLTRFGHSRGPSEDSVAINTRGDMSMPTSSPVKANYGNIALNASTSHLKVPSGSAPAAAEYGISPSMSAPAINSMDRVDPIDGVTIRLGDKTVSIRSQIQLYTTNNLLTHPLVSPVTGYLGGLPPLYILASDKEVLRDEIIYLAHKAANPAKYPFRQDLRTLYPALPDVSTLSNLPVTQVHLQVYDDTCHVLPLFTFATPAKFAYRSVAAFCKQVMPDRALFAPFSVDLSLGDFAPPESPTMRRNQSLTSRSPSFRLSTILTRNKGGMAPTSPVRSNTAGSLRRAGSFDARPSEDGASRLARDSADGGPGTAGFADCYKLKPLSNEMIRERVSTKGIIRDMEPEDEITALELTTGMVGMVNEIGVKRYLDAQSAWDKKFKDAMKAVSKHRKKQIASGEAEDRVRFKRLKEAVFTKDVDESEKNKVLNSPKWSWAWVVSGDENPPPSSIVARRDTVEARRLSKIADEAVEEKESSMSGNSLWTTIANVLTTSTDLAPPKSPIGTPFPNLEPSSPSRAGFRSYGLASTSSLSTSVSGDFVRIPRPSFGSLRVGRSKYVDANGDFITNRHSIVPDIPPALPSVGTMGRDDGFVKGALEGIAEVRVSEDMPAPPVKVPTPLGSSLAKANGDLKRIASGRSTPVKRKAVPPKLFEEAGVEPSQSPSTSQEAIARVSSSSKAAADAQYNSNSSPSKTNGVPISPPMPSSPVPAMTNGKAT